MTTGNFDDRTPDLPFTLSSDYEIGKQIADLADWQQVTGLPVGYRSGLYDLLSRLPGAQIVAVDPCDPMEDGSCSALMMILEDPDGSLFSVVLESSPKDNYQDGSAPLGSIQVYHKNCNFLKSHENMQK